MLLLFTVNNIVYKQKSMMSPMWLSICTFLQNFMALSLSVFELRWSKKKKMTNKTPYHSPIHHHVNPYILSTTVLSDNNDASYHAHPYIQSTTLLSVSYDKFIRPVVTTV